MIWVQNNLPALIDFLIRRELMYFEANIAAVFEEM